MEETPAVQSEFREVYSPGTILGIYAAAIRSSADGKMIVAKGIYEASLNQKEYGGYFYDSIKSPHENKSIRARIPVLIRSKLENRQVYTFKGYIEKKINFSAIEIIFVVDDVLQKEENPFTSEDIRRLEIIQLKSSRGYHDIEALVKTSLYSGRLLRIVNLYGSTAIVDKDFNKGLAEAVTRFSITNHRCNFASKEELISAITSLNNSGYDIIALVRGGGEKASMEVFNDSLLCQTAINVKPHIISALGHTVDESLFDKVADKRFALPHDYGNSLKVWVDEAAQEQARSKSIFIEQVKVDLTKTFHSQIATLSTQLEARNKEFEIADAKYKEMLEHSNKEKDETLQAKQKSFESMLNSLTEQLKSKEQLLASLQANAEQSTRNQISAETAALKAKIEILNAEKSALASKENGGNTLIYVLIAAVIGLILGILLKG